MWLPDNSTSGITDLGSGITEFSLSPYSNTDIKWHLAYIENNNVMYVPITAAYWPQAGTPQTVCEGDESVYLNAPSISSLNANTTSDPIGVTWQAYYWEFVTGVIQYSERNTQTWSYPAMWVPYYTTASYVKPSVTGSIGTPKATIAWQTTETPLMYTVRGRPGSWGSVASMGGGVDPTLSAGYLANSFEYLVSRGTTSIQSHNHHQVRSPRSIASVVGGLRSFGPEGHGTRKRPEGRRVSLCNMGRFERCKRCLFCAVHSDGWQRQCAAEQGEQVGADEMTAMTRRCRDRSPDLHCPKGESRRLALVECFRPIWQFCRAVSIL